MRRREGLDIRRMDGIEVARRGQARDLHQSAGDAASRYFSDPWALGGSEPQIARQRSNAIDACIVDQFHRDIYSYYDPHPFAVICEASCFRIRLNVVFEPLS